MNHLHNPTRSEIKAFVERLAERKEKYGDKYPVIWYDLKIETEEKRVLKGLIQKNESIHFFQDYIQVLQFAQSLGISFALVVSGDLDEKRFYEDLKSLFTFGRRMGQLEEEEVLKDLIKGISDDMAKGIKVYAFYTLLDALTEAPFQKDEEDVTVMGDMNNMVKDFRQEFALIFYDPNVASENKEKLVEGLEIEIGKENLYTNLMDLLQYIKNYNGPPYHLIMAGKDLEEKTVNEAVGSKDLLGLYIYRDDDILDKIKNEKIDKAKTLEELIPKIKQGLRTRSKLNNNFPAFATDFDAWDRSHINYVHHYLKGLVHFNNRKQAKDDFLKLARKIYQDENKMLSRFEETYDKAKDDDEDEDDEEDEKKKNEKKDKESILYWYTRDSPIYRLLNNCLRIATSDSILACRLILKDMETAIREKYKAKDKDFNGLLYRGAYISAEEWDKLQKNIGQEIEMYGFLSTSMAKRAAFNFLRSDPQNKIFITIIVPPLPELDEQGFVDVSEFSEFGGEKEILFNVRSKFKILQAAVGKIDERGNRARHLVLLFGAQLLRKYMTKNKPTINLELELPSQEIIQQCKICGKRNNLFGFQQEEAQVCCFDCLVKNSVPKDILILSLNGKTKNYTEHVVMGKKLQFTKEAPSFTLSDYKCCDCQVSGKSNYLKWITQDGKELRQCLECFEKKKEIKADFLVSETYPYTFWLEHQKEWEKIDADYKSGLSKNSQYANEGDVYIEVQDLHRCIEYGEKVLKKLKLTRRRERTKLKTYKMLGTAYESLSQHREAENCFKLAIDLGETVYDPAIITLYNSLAEVSENLSKIEEAKENHERALRMAKLMYGEESLDAAISYNGLASICKNQGQHQQSLKHFVTALEITKRLVGENHPETATSYNNIAVVYRSLGKGQEAKENFIKAFDIRIAIFGENHPETAASYHNLAEFHKGFCDFTTATQYFKKAIEILKPFYGEKHSIIAASCNGLGTIYDYLKEFEEAKEYHEKALEITKYFKGERHQDTATSYNNLALAEKNLKNFEIAKDLFMKALKIKESLYGEKAHPDIACLYTNLALVSQELEKPEIALEYATKSLEMTISIYGEMHKDTANSYNNLARVYESFLNLTEIIKNYSKALDIYKEVHGEKHLDTAGVYFNLGCVQAAIGNQMGKENLSKAFHIRKEILGDEHEDTIEAEEMMRTVGN